MASQTMAFVQNAKSQGKKDSQIWNELRKDPDFNNSVKRARSAGITQEQIAKDFGLNIRFVDSKPKSNYQPFDNTKEARQKREQEALKKQGPTQLWESALLGAADIGVPFVQGAQYVKDKINQGVNAVAGTKLPTNSYEGVTKTYKNINDAHNTVRKANNQGIDVGRIGANMVMTAPLAAAGGTLPSGAKLISKAGAEFLGKNAALGGLIGATGVHENNTERLKSIAAGAAGGAIGAAAGQKIGEGVTKVARKTIPSVKAATQVRVNQTIDDQIEIALKQSNVKIGDLSDDIIAGLRKDVGAALKSGKAVNKEAIARKVVFDRLGIKPTQAQLTGSPQLWQKQAELAKIQGAGDPLRQKLVQDNQQLAGLLDDVALKTGGKADDAYGAASGAIDALKGQQAQNKEFIGAAYDAARKSAGNDIVLDGRGFANDAITRLDEQYAMSSLPASVRKIIGDIEKNPDAFTLGKSEELIKILNREYKSSLMNGQPSSSTYAIGVVRDALEGRQGEAMQGLLANGGNDAAQAYQFARDAYKFNAQQIEGIPLLQDAMKGVEPDKLFQKHFLNGNVNDIQRTVYLLNNVNPQSVANIKEQVIKHISEKAINQNGQFSPAGMKRALDAIGDRRLNTLFTPDEVARIKDIGMAGQYLVTQPAHSYVNNSNTSAALMNFLGGIINKPGVRVLLSPLKDVADSVQVNRALKANITSDAKASAEVVNNMLLSEGDKNLIEQLTKLGLIGGANSTQ
ncbi:MULTISPECIES: hypothetical protein [Acinetobacter]|uniref:hypothetical protein n=1 Tax=Acinetobacter TaxID=469 RepID=UPI00244BB2C0|nr:hypothetical protein [Acinetobacter baumannii]MDH2644769.1 hypothetical protein [Acinetobacter baumannii]